MIRELKKRSKEERRERKRLIEGGLSLAMIY